MSLPPSPPPSRSLQIIQSILYILAVLVLVPGLIAGTGLMTGASNLVANALLPLQLVGGEITNNLLAPVLTGFLVNLGIGILALSIIVSALLYGLGRLIGHTALLESRLARLEIKALQGNRDSD